MLSDIPEIIGRGAFEILGILLNLYCDLMFTIRQERRILNFTFQPHTSTVCSKD